MNQTTRLSLPVPALSDLIETGQSNIAEISNTLDNAVQVYGTSDVLPSSNSYPVGSILLHQLTGAPPVVYISTTFGWVQISAFTPFAGGSNAPLGSVIPIIGGGTGWLPCDGAMYPIANHPELHSLIGTQYGGNGITTFAVPNISSLIAAGTPQSPGGEAIEYYIKATP